MKIAKISWMDKISNEEFKFCMGQKHRWICFAA